MAHIARGAGTLYDTEVVRAFLRVVGHGASSIADRQEPEAHPGSPRHDDRRSTANIS
jgi:hypothetical protein